MTVRIASGGLIACLLLFFLAVPAGAELTTVRTRLHLTHDSVDMPAPDERMGLVGVHYLVDVTPHLFAGIGGFGSVTGDRGGFLTGGLAGGFRAKLTRRLGVEAGLYVGGGGGGGAAQGDGLMLRGHAGLTCDFDRFRLGIAYSRVNFPETDIGSDGISASFDIPFTGYLVGGHPSLKTAADATLPTGDRSAGFVRQDILFKSRTYDPAHDARDTSASPFANRIRLVGTQYRRSLAGSTYALAEAMGAVDGQADGYAELHLGVGYRVPVISGDGLLFDINLALGAGGGGAIDVGGGALARVEAGLSYRLTPACFAGLNGGYIDSLDGSFAATIIGAEVGISLDTLSSGPGTRPIADHDERAWQHWRLRTAHLTYGAPERKTIDDDQAIHLIGVKLDHLLSDRIYLTGQAAGAYSGEAGGYAVGLIGVGLQSPPLGGTRLRLFAELLSGASGGGGIAVGEGAIWQPMAGIGWAIDDRFGLQALGGVVRAVDGELASPVFDLSLTWRFSTLGRRLP